MKTAKYEIGQAVLVNDHGMHAAKVTHVGYSNRLECTMYRVVGESVSGDYREDWLQPAVTQFELDCGGFGD